jgi:NTP pyrophosphatase (non-canonical NTP hydrolase)
MDPRYLRPGFDFALAHAIEEAGEFLAAAGKTQRWGRTSVNPNLPADEQESNEAWLGRELGDLIGALGRLRRTMGGVGMTSNPAHLPDEVIR